MIPVQVRGVLSFLSLGEHRNSPSELPVCVGNELQQEPRILLHVSISPELWEIAVRSNQCLSMLAWVHLHWDAMELSESDTSRHPPLLASFIWQLWLCPER